MSQKLIPSLELFLKSAKCAMSDLDAIVVYRGPGSYTSLRIGISCANSLAFALDIPIKGISKLDDFTPEIIQNIKFESSFTKPAEPFYQQAI